MSPKTMFQVFTLFFIVRASSAFTVNLGGFFSRGSYMPVHETIAYECELFIHPDFRDSCNRIASHPIIVGMGENVVGTSEGQELLLSNMTTNGTNKIESEKVDNEEYKTEKNVTSDRKKRELNDVQTPIDVDDNRFVKSAFITKCRKSNFCFRFPWKLLCNWPASGGLVSRILHRRALIPVIKLKNGKSFSSCNVDTCEAVYQEC